MQYSNYIREKTKNLIKTGEAFGYPLTLSKSKGKNLKDYKIYGNSVQGGLPDEYQEVEYIETDGNAYIDTGIVPNAYTKMVETFQLNTAKYTAVAGIAGVIESNVLYRFSFFTNKSNLVNKNQVSAGIGYTFNSADVPEMDTNIHTLEMYQDDTTQYFVADRTTLTSSAQIDNANLIAHSAWVGYRNDLRASKSIGISHKIYRFSMYTRNSFTEAFTPQINLIPCYRKSDNIIGLYDTVNGVFYTNAGTGTFTKGNDITPTPDNPIEVESVGEKTKNLFNYKEYFANKVIAYTGASNNRVNYKLKPNTTYTISTNYPNRNGLAVFFAKQGQYNNASNAPTTANDGIYYGKSRTITTDNDGYLYIASRNSASSVTPPNIEEFNSKTYYIQLKEGSTDINYEPYGYKIPVKVNDITTNIYLDEPLRKFKEYADYIDFGKQKVVRNVVEGILDGSEGWNSSGKRYYYYNTKLNIKCLGNGVAGIKSNALPSRTWNEIRNSGTGIATYTNGVVHNRIDIRADNIWSTVDEAKEYLANNPIQYIGPALNPTEETLDLPVISTNAGTNIIEVDTLVKPSNIYAKYIKK